MIFVRNWLAIGSHDETRQPDLLRQQEIGAMLLLSTPTEQPTVPSLYLRMHDAAYVPPRIIAQGVNFIHDQRNWGRRILIACNTGLSVAPAMAIAALKEKGDLTLIEAYRHMLRVHPDAQPHPILWDSLCSYYEDELPFDVLWFQIQLLVQQHTTN